MKDSSIIKPILLGVATGDALGFPYQFADRFVRQTHRVIDMGLTEGPGGARTHAPDKLMGLWSDDTSLSLCLAESLASGYNLVDISRKFIAWLFEGHLSARDRAFDVGGQTSAAIHDLRNIIDRQDYERLNHLIDRQFEPANGNGALMRILPLLAHIQPLDIHEQLKIVTAVSALTHPHWRSTVCCMWYLRYALRIVEGVDKYEAMLSTQAELRELIKGIPLSPLDHKELDRLLNKDLSRGTTDAAASMTPDYIHSGGYVVHTLEASIHCLLNRDNFQDTLLTAVNLGDDTDTVGAVVGGLAALLYGVEAIPPHWIASLKRPELIWQVIGLFD